MRILSYYIMLSFCFSVQAKKLYKYQDRKGIWHFSDQAPSTEQPVEVRQLKPAKKKYVRLQKTKNKQSPGYYIDNAYPAPIELEFVLKDSVNAQAVPALPKRYIVPSGRSAVLFKIQTIDQFKSWSYTLSYRYVLGSSLAEHESQTVYLPPFAKNSRFRITQGFNGQFSHADKQNKYAVDIAMPLNTPVYAARSGTVIEVNDDFYVSGTRQAYKSQANSIRILHDDGSMGVYAHLALEKAQVYKGLRVYAGQLIAYSGNTGFSSGPHLHFAVQVNKGMQLVSVPFQFQQANGEFLSPCEGCYLAN